MRRPAPPQAPTKVPVEYVDFANVFSPDLVSELPEHFGINDHAIELVDGNGFIRPSKSPIAAPLTWMLRTSSSTDSSASAAQIVVE